MPSWTPGRLAARLPFLDARARLTAGTHAFFAERHVREVEAPCLMPAPGMEVHLRGFSTHCEPHLGQGAAQIYGSAPHPNER